MSKAAVEFLGHLFWSRGRLAVLTAILNGGGTMTESFNGYQWRECRDFIKTHNGKLNLYYMVNDPGRPLTKKASKGDVVRLDALHVDVDDISPAALARIQAHVPPPTVVVCSGNGYNCLWLLKKPLPTTHMSDIEARNRGLITALDGDPACWNADRILRLPETWNLPSAVKVKRGMVKVRSFLVEAHWSRRYDPEQFPKGEKLGTAATIEPVHLSGELPELDFERLPLEGHWKITIRNGKDLSDPDRYASRSECMFACVCAMVSAGVPHDVIASALLDTDCGISKHVLEQSHPLRYAARQIERAVAVIS